MQICLLLSKHFTVANVFTFLLWTERSLETFFVNSFVKRRKATIRNITVARDRRLYTPAAPLPWNRTFSHEEGGVYGAGRCGARDVGSHPRQALVSNSRKRAVIEVKIDNLTRRVGHNRLIKRACAPKQDVVVVKVKNEDMWREESCLDMAELRCRYAGHYACITASACEDKELHVFLARIQKLGVSVVNPLLISFFETMSVGLSHMTTSSPC